MAWRISGSYVTCCSCTRETHWPIDGSLSDAAGECSSVAVFDVENGSFDDTDLSGVQFAIYNFFPPKLSTGYWNVGLVVDRDASDDQATAIERIVNGTSGGPFAATAFMVGEYFGMDRADIDYLAEGTPSANVDGRSAFKLEVSDASAPNAMFPFASEFRVGRTIGKNKAFGFTWEAGYGESGRFSFSNETMAVEAGWRTGR